MTSWPWTVPPKVAVAAVLSEAGRFLGVVEDPKGSNRGVEVDYFVREAGLDPKGAYPWCAAYVGQMGRQALGHVWPCPRTPGVMALVKWAKEDTAKRWKMQPEVGDLFVLWNAAVDGGRYAHIGFVSAVATDEFTTLEGNSNNAGGREGYGVYSLTRKRLTTTRYIRWTSELLGSR